MTDPLEQRLRAALEAYAQTVTPDALDPAKATEIQQVLQSPRRWPTLLLGGGAAAAAVLIGALAVGQLGDDGQGGDTASSDPSPRSSAAPASEPTAPTAATTTSGEQPSTEAPSTGSSSAPNPLPTPAQTDGPAPGATPSAPRTPSSPSPATPAPRQPDVPAATPTAPADPTDSASSSPSTSTTLGPRMPTTEAPEPPAAVRVSVQAAAQQGRVLAWRASASGQAQAPTPGGGILAYEVDYGDGRTTSSATASSCDAADPVRPVNFSIDTASEPHVYTEPGTYRISVAVTYCGDGGERRNAADSATVTVE